MKKIICSLLIKAIDAACKVENAIKQDVSKFEDNFVVVLKFMPKNICVAFKINNGKIKKIKDFEASNLIIEFIDDKISNKVLIGRLSIANAFAMHKIKLYGNINHAIMLTRIINLVECYLFPHFITSKLFEPMPIMHASKLKFFIKLIFGGK